MEQPLVRGAPSGLVALVSTEEVYIARNVSKVRKSGTRGILSDVSECEKCDDSKGSKVCSEVSKVSKVRLRKT